MMIQMNIYFVILFSLLLQGCAVNSTMALKAEDKDSFRSSKVASSYFMVNKTVDYTEVLYRVLWAEHRASSMDFSGVWEPDDELSIVVNNKLKNASINAIKVTDLIDARTLDEYYFSKIGENLPSNANATDERLLLSYLNQYPKYTGFESVRNLLLEKGVYYLFEVVSLGTYANAFGFGGVRIGSSQHMRILDLHDKKILWSAAFTGGENYQLGGNLRKLELNNLALLKEGVTLSLKDSMSKGLNSVFNEK